MCVTSQAQSNGNYYSAWETTKKVPPFFLVLTPCQSSFKITNAENVQRNSHEKFYVCTSKVNVQVKETVYYRIHISYSIFPETKDIRIRILRILVAETKLADVRDIDVGELLRGYV